MATACSVYNIIDKEATIKYTTTFNINCMRTQYTRSVLHLSPLQCVHLRLSCGVILSEHCPIRPTEGSSSTIVDCSNAHQRYQDGQ